MEGNTQPVEQRRPHVPAAFSLVRAMTVAELIERLSEVPQHASVLVRDTPLTKDDLRLFHNTPVGAAIKIRVCENFSGCSECCEHMDRCMHYEAEG